MTFFFFLKSCNRWKSSGSRICVHYIRSWIMALAANQGLIPQNCNILGPPSYAACKALAQYEGQINLAAK
jgi:hypothetical protein